MGVFVCFGGYKSEVRLRLRMGWAEDDAECKGRGVSQNGLKQMLPTHHTHNTFNTFKLHLISRL